MAVFAAALFATAWLSDDAFITFRIVDNFHSGHGLVWNVGERVQAATHPLWLLIISAVSTYTGDLVFTTLAVSIVVSSAAVLAAAAVTAGRFAPLLLIAVLASSRSFLDFSTSGLENCLSHLLMAAFLWFWWRRGGEEAPRLDWGLGLTAGLLVFTRLDLALLVVPALTARIAARPRAATVARVAAGALPLVCWLGFSLLYYGFALPNTAWAKQLALGLPRPALLANGMRYLADSAAVDPVTLTAILLALALGILGRFEDGPVAAGVGASLVYTVWVGGDFMSGRFLSVPVFCSAILLARRLPLLSNRLRLAVIVALVCTAGTSAAFRTGLLPEFLPRAPGVTDEARWYAELRLVRLLATDGASLSKHPMARGGTDLGASGAPTVEIAKAVGMRGYFAGEQVHIIDALGLTDPLIARLPVGDRWRPGHYPRLIPTGYPETVASGTNAIADPDLAAYYSLLAQVTRDPVFAPSRLRALRELRLGEGPGRLEAYRQRIGAAIRARYGGPPPGPGA